MRTYHLVRLISRHGCCLLINFIRVGSAWRQVWTLLTAMDTLTLPYQPILQVQEQSFSQLEAGNYTQAQLILANTCSVELFWIYFVEGPYIILEVGCGIKWSNNRRLVSRALLLKSTCSELHFISSQLRKNVWDTTPSLRVRCPTTRALLTGFGSSGSSSFLQLVPQEVQLPDCSANNGSEASYSETITRIFRGLKLPLIWYRKLLLSHYLYSTG